MLSLVVPSSIFVTHPKPPVTVGQGELCSSSLQDSGSASASVRIVDGTGSKKQPTVMWALLVAFVLFVCWAAVITPSAPGPRNQSYQDSVMIATTMADMEYRSGNYQKAADEYKGALKDAYRVFGDYDPRTARIMLGLAQADYKLGDFQTAMGGALTAGTLYAGAYGYGAKSAEYIDCQVTRGESLMGLHDYVDAGGVLLQELPKTENPGSSRIAQLRARILQDLKENASHITGKSSAERSVLVRTEEAVKSAQPSKTLQP